MHVKLYATALATFGLLLCGGVNAHADRLYTWTDAKGQTHITQDPPPETAKVIDTIDYSPHPDEAIRRPRSSNRPDQPQGNLGRRSGKEAAGPDAGFTSEEAGDDAEYPYDRAYRRTLRGYERRHERLDNSVPDQEGDLPGRVRPRPHMR